MKISFFEEFPNKRNLSKLDLVNFSTKLYLAASSVKEFLRIKKRMGGKFVKEIVYWPVLEDKEGYWISSFSKRKALLRVFNELEKKRIPVMLDLELPTTKNFWLYFTQAVNFFRNKRLIKKFIRNYGGEVYLAEYFPIGKIKLRLLKFLGLHYNVKKARVIKMLYHSMLPFSESLFEEELKLGKKRFGKGYLAGLGTIAKGVLSWEPILSPEKLRKDLESAKNIGVEEAVIFRLGGLNQEYLKVIKDFV